VVEITKDESIHNAIKGDVATKQPVDNRDVKRDCIVAYEDSFWTISNPIAEKMKAIRTKNKSFPSKRVFQDNQPHTRRWDRVGFNVNYPIVIIIFVGQVQVLQLLRIR
jgi:hypothetical protein